MRVLDEGMTAAADERRRIPGTWWGLALAQALIALAAALTLPTLVADRARVPVAGPTTTSTTAASTVPGPSEAELTRLFKARAAALLARDRPAYLKLTVAKSKAAGAAATFFANIRAVPLSAYGEEPDVKTIRAVPGGRGHRLEVVRTYRLRGFDAGDVRQRRLVTVEPRGTSWRITNDVRAKGERRELWEAGPVVVERGAASLVLAHPADKWRLPAYARHADAAVAAVTDVWGTDWSRKAVVVVPASAKELGGVLGSTLDYSKIAALATAELLDDGGRRTSMADRVVINPATFGQLTSQGQRIVMTHEVTHVATRVATGRTAPMWVVEGFADYVAYRNEGLSARVIARDLVPMVQRGAVPATLPKDRDFEPDAPALAAAYEQAWLACRHIAERTSEADLIAFYRAVGAARGDARAVVDEQFTAVLGTTTASFTRSWRRYVESELT